MSTPTSGEHRANGRALPVSAPGQGTAAADTGNSALRRAMYWILIAVSAGSMSGRILAVNSVDFVRLEKYLQEQGRADWQKQRPFLSANDRSRWCTVRSLVEHGTYKIDQIVEQPNWDTIDMVKHDGHGRQAPEATKGHLYSSKPPLLATLMAGPYWVIHRLTGATLGTHPYAIGRGLLILFNVVPLVIYLALIGRTVEWFGTTDWGRLFVMASAAFGTFLTTFSVAANNHVTAAVSAMIALHASLVIWYTPDRRFRWFVLAGFFAAFAAANELPAMTFLAVVSGAIIWKSPRRALMAYVPPAAIVAAAALGTNYISHGTWRPPYAHRVSGDNWYNYQFMRGGKIRESYWSHRESRSPVDQGEPSRSMYAMHVLVGHHGIFSLTPIWLLSLVGVAKLLVRGQPNWRALGLLIASISVVCLAFYLARPIDDRNYGGMTSGFRWAFWLAPLWLVAMLPAVDAAARCRWYRTLAGVLLAFSVLSASYPTWNPWTHPWLTDILLHLEWVNLGTRPIL